MSEKETKQVNPWLQLWITPKKTLQDILISDPQRVILWLAFISGILTALLTIFILEEKHTLPPLFIGGIIIGGILFGILQLYVLSWLYHLVGIWLGGKGSYIAVKCAVGWSFYPMILGQILSLISLWVLSYPLMLVLNFIGLVINVWAIVILVLLIAQAHLFSAWRAIGTLVLTFLLIFVAFMLVSLLIPLISPLFTS